MSAHQTPLFELGFPRSLASFPSSLSWSTVFLLWPTAYLGYASTAGTSTRPAVRTRSGVEGVVKLVYGYPFSVSALVDLDYD